MVGGLMHLRMLTNTSVVPTIFVFRVATSNLSSVLIAPVLCRAARV